MKRNDDGAWTRFKTRAESMESKKGDNIVISVGLLLIIIVALSLSGCADETYVVSSAGFDLATELEKLNEYSVRF